MNLIESLRQFDGKRTSDLERLSASMPRSADSVARLLAVAEHDDTTVQVGATWILKRWLEEGVPHVERSAVHLVQLLTHATYWQVRLHLLQMLASLRAPVKSLSVLTKVLPGLLMDENKFVRAWALAALADVADQTEALRQDVISMIQNAENDDAASVRARVRQIQKRHKWVTQAGRTKQ
jgi:HEAT repeat protein